MKILQIQYKFNKNDEYYTPDYAVIPIMNKIPKGSKIWCPFDTSDSQYVKVFKDNGYEVINTHISNGEDFFTIDVPECDYIISNPPYSQKNEVFKKLYEIGKPFAMLINFQGIFDHKERFKLFKNNKLEIMYLNPRVNYIKPDTYEKAGVPFQSGYLCSGILDNQIEFEYMKRGETNGSSS